MMERNKKLALGGALAALTVGGIALAVRSGGGSDSQTWHGFQIELEPEPTDDLYRWAVLKNGTLLRTNKSENKAEALSDAKDAISQMSNTWELS